MATLDEAIERSAEPAASRHSLERLVAAQPDAATLLADDPALAAAFVAVSGASHPLARFLETDPGALAVLTVLDERPAIAAATGDELRRWKGLEELRIAARDLLGVDSLDVTVAALAALAIDVLGEAYRLLAADGPPLAVVGMGKLGGAELNYASDIDVMFVGDGDPAELHKQARRLIEFVRTTYRVDVDLRPEGRVGPLVRSLASFEAYWERWAEPWEFQALLKARSVAGDAQLGGRFDESAGRAAVVADVQRRRSPGLAPPQGEK